MNKQYKKTLFIFRRDLRLKDNTGLIEALKSSEQVITCFIFDPQQISDKNQYKSDNAIQFMLESLEDLESELIQNNGNLYLLTGDPCKIIEDLLTNEKIEAVFTNRDYTPFSLKRDESIKHICFKNKVEFKQCNDLLLTEPEEILTGNNTPYTIFTAFFKKASKKIITVPIPNNFRNYYTQPINSLKQNNISKKQNDNLRQKGGRKNALKILKSLSKFKDYEKDKDYPEKSTTNLSAHIKFGTVSIREVYHAIAKELSYGHPLIRQLFWRDFFTHIIYDSPFVLGHAYKQKYDNIKWNYNKKLFEAWCKGETGFPIVDAGMRQLNETGFMHNRVRLITASFLVKDLHMDWQMGEKYFARKLEDYDPAVNNGNWQWVASTGCDMQPYFRIFNPWLQQKKFDPDCKYIKKWVPELKSSEPKIIHNLYNRQTTIKDYPKPIVDHDTEKQITLNIYKSI